MDRNAARHWSAKFLDRVRRADKANAQLDRLSGGQQQKVRLAVTVMNDPELLILNG